MSRKHVGPAPSERALIELWDRIDQERMRGGEKAASALASKALAAVKETKPNDTQRA